MYVAWPGVSQLGRGTKVEGQETLLGTLATVGCHQAGGSMPAIIFYC